MQSRSKKISPESNCGSGVLPTIASGTSGDLIAERDNWYQIFESISDSTVIIDKNNTVVEANKATLSLLKRSREEIIGKKCYELFHDTHCIQENCPHSILLKHHKPATAEMEIEALGRYCMVTTSPIFDKNGNLDKVIHSVKDITENKQLLMRQELHGRVLDILNRANDWRNLINDLLLEIKQFTKFDAVGIRLHDGGDYPYYVTAGFSDSFVQTETKLCTSDEHGTLLRDEKGHLVLECMCGAVIAGRTDPSLPFFTQGGSFWTNSTTRLLAETPPEQKGVTRNRCNSEGYESVALIPLRCGENIIGLVQLNNTKPDSFTPDFIKFFEKLSNSIGIALKRKQVQEDFEAGEQQLRAANQQLRASEQQLRAANQQLRASEAELESLAKFPSENPHPVLRVHNDGTILYHNNASTPLLEYWQCQSGSKLPNPCYTLVKDAFMNRHVIQSEVQCNDIIFSLAFAPVPKNGYVNIYATDITDRRRTQEQLVQSEERFRLSMEQSPAVIEMYDLDGTQVAVNKAYEKLWGFPAEHTLFRFNLFQSEEVKRKGLMKYLERAYAGESLTLPEYEFDSSGNTESRGLGRKRWLHTRIYPIKNNHGDVENIVIMHEDITERKKTEQQLQYSRRILNETGKMARIGGWEHDLQTGTALWTEALYDIIEIPYDQPVPGPNEHLSFYPENDRLRLRQAYQRVIEEHVPFDHEFEVFTAKQKPIWARIYGEPILENGKCIKIRGTFQDITERKKAEREREKLMRMLESKNEELQSIVYVSSHDLRTPLVNITGFGKHLADHCTQLRKMMKACADSFDDQTRQTVEILLHHDIAEDLEFITQSAHKMNSLINGLLNVSRVGTVSLSMTQLDMNRLIRDIINNMAYTSQKMGAEITADDLSPCIGDSSQISQIFMNLIDNSLKYAHPSRNPRIHISCTTEDEQCTYCVQDNGVGIHPEYHAKIFEIFHRLDPKNSPDGEGLGLTIIRRIVDRHNGKVRVESVPEQGSQFFISLPNKEAS